MLVTGQVPYGVALALGTNAVAVGRAYLWGLAAAGEVGVGNVLDILCDGLDSGCSGRASPRSRTWPHD